MFGSVTASIKKYQEQLKNAENARAFVESQIHKKEKELGIMQGEGLPGVFRED